MSNTTVSSRKTSVGREELISTNTRIGQAAVASATQHQTIKVAIDVHSSLFVASRQLDNATPQPPQKFTPEQLLKFIGRQVAHAVRVVCCYEAGCFGYGLQREIAAQWEAPQCLVIAPQDWDERKKNVRTDRTDTTAMVLHLDRYVAGNRKAAFWRWCVFPVWPRRCCAEPVSAAAGNNSSPIATATPTGGKSLLLEYGLGASWSWWRPDRWEATHAKAVKEGMGCEQAATLLAMLEGLSRCVDEGVWEIPAVKLTGEQEKKQKERAGRTQTPWRLRGIGELEAWPRSRPEIGDWKRRSPTAGRSPATRDCAPGVSWHRREVREPVGQPNAGTEDCAAC